MTAVAQRLAPIVFSAGLGVCTASDFLCLHPAAMTRSRKQGRYFTREDLIFKVFPNDKGL
jgi:hypothetical protein